MTDIIGKQFSRIFTLLLVMTSACSSGSYLTQEGFLGSAVGAVGGSGLGYLIGQQVGKKTENVAIAASVGAGLGLLGGAWLHEQNSRYSEENQTVVREAKLIESQQHEIDHLRGLIYDSSSWGDNDRNKSWDQRYNIDQSAIPYQGQIK